MRRRLALTALAVSLFALSCTQDQQEGPTEPGSTAAAPKSPCPSTDPIQSQICALFPATDLLKSASDFYNNVQTKVRQGREKEAQARAVELVNFTFRQFDAGKLLDPSGSPTTQESVVQLTCDVFDYVGSGWTDCEADLGTGLTPSMSPHSTVEVCGPAGCLVRPEDKHSGVSVPSEACPTLCIISVDPIPPSQASPRDGPLSHLTNLDQYPLFRELKLVAPFDEFAVPVTVGICHLSASDGGPFAPPDDATEKRLQLAHPHPSGEGIEILAKVAAPFLDCSDLFASNDEFAPPRVIGGSARSLRLGEFASAAQSMFARALSPVLEALLPEPAEATILGSCCLGGTTSKFSPWAAVDPQSGQELGLISEPNDHDNNRNYFVGSSIRPCSDGCQDLLVEMKNASGTIVGAGTIVTATLLTVNAPAGTTPALGGDNTQPIGSSESGATFATFNDLEVSQPGRYQLKFEAPGAVPVTSAEFDVYKFEFTLQPTAEPEGTVFEGQLLGEADQPAFVNPVLRISILDYQGNVVTAASDLMQVTLPIDPLLLSGDTRINATNGVANFTTLEASPQTGLSVTIADENKCQEGAPLQRRGTLVAWPHDADQIQSTPFNVRPVCIL